MFYVAAFLLLLVSSYASALAPPGRGSRFMLISTEITVTEGRDFALTQHVTPDELLLQFSNMFDTGLIRRVYIYRMWVRVPWSGQVIFHWFVVVQTHDRWWISIDINRKGHVIIQTGSLHYVRSTFLDRPRYYVYLVSRKYSFMTVVEIFNWFNTVTLIYSRQYRYSVDRIFTYQLFRRLTVVGSCTPYEQFSGLWTTYKTTFSKTYISVYEETYRRSVFGINIQYISRHNLQAELGVYTFTLGINEYADLTSYEFTHYMLGGALSSPCQQSSYVANHTFDVASFSGVTPPAAVDWRTQGYVTGVKNQGRCGSCWTFAATGALEGQWFSKTGNLVSLSEQNLIDCSTANYGCGGGWTYKAFDYIINNNGIDTEQSYPYEGKGMSCRYNAATVGATCSDWKVMPPTEGVLQQAVAELGPIAVSIDASRPSFHMYKSGIYVEPLCSKTSNHVVLVVGYGSMQGQDYWILKNSWGPTWGMQGYMLMARNMNNQCGIADCAVLPVV
jgi:hypothetical protein